MEQQVAKLSGIALEKFSEYMGNLDWPYIITLIIISHFISQDDIIIKGKISTNKFISKIRPFLLSIPRAWRVFLIGIIYGLFIYWVRSYSNKEPIEVIFQSLIFAMISHKLLLEKIMNRYLSKDE